jgi:hypothetical protein
MWAHKLGTEWCMPLEVYKQIYMLIVCAQTQQHSIIQNMNINSASFTYGHSAHVV